jgi:hypothetical protein
VEIVPSHDLVIVRLGELGGTSYEELNAQLAELARAFPERRAP